MMKLIRLEWKKNNILKCIRNAAITTAVLLVFILMTAGELETQEPVEMYGKGMLDSFVALLVHMSYIVFTGVMIAAYIVGAYEKKMMNLMFSYPIERKRIILAKVSAVWIFNFLAMVTSKIVIYIALVLSKSFMGITAQSIPIGELSFWLDIVLSSAAMVSISFIALPIGLKMKSSKAAIVASVLIVCFTQGNIGGATLVNSLPFYGILLVAAVVSVYLSIYNIETKDLL